MFEKWVGRNQIMLDTNGVAMARHGLILWENDARRLNIIFKAYFWPPEAYKYVKTNLKYALTALGYTIPYP